MTKQIKIDSDLHNSFFAWCKLSDKKMKGVVEELIRDHMARNPIKNSILSLKVNLRSKVTS